MKRILLLLFPLLFLTACSMIMPISDEPQESEADTLHSALTEYTNATINHEVDKLITFVYPKVFTLIDKDQMVYLLKKIEASGKAPKITQIAHKDISDIYTYEKGVYSIILSDMYMELKSPVINNPEYEMFLYVMLKKQMGGDAVIDFDKSRHLYRIKKDSKIIGINEENQGWKFVGYEQAKKYASWDIIPKEIALHLK
ncbi:MAG: hypothetical protein IE889_07795 [Campylobacterales bacterium]|nr:hypothetical protein [Campylobacterales bacterium]